LDYIEEREGRLLGFEFKYMAKIVRAPKSWLEGYDNASYDFLEFIT
jgi:hypothetical protein